MKIVPFVRTLRAGDTVARVRALRQGNQVLTVSVTGAALRLGVLSSLQAGPRTTEQLAGRLGWSDLALAESVVQLLAAYRLVERSDTGWELTRRARRILADDVVQAAYEAFGGYHADLYRGIGGQLRGGARRRDIEDEGQLVARLSRFLDEFVLAEIDRVVAERPPDRVLDVGCGAGSHLVHLLRTAPGATGCGVEVDGTAAALARGAIAAAGLEDRAEIVESDVRDHLAGGVGEPYDLVLLSNVVYYVPPAERVPLLEVLAQSLAPGGRLLLVTTALTDEPFSRHFDLLLRAHDGDRQLPDMGVLADQVREAGLRPEPPRRIAPGEPLTALLARRPA